MGVGGRVQGDGGRVEEGGRVHGYRGKGGERGWVQEGRGGGCRATVSSPRQGTAAPPPLPRGAWIVCSSR